MPEPQSEESPGVEIKARGTLSDGVIKMSVELGSAKIDVTYDNVQEGYDHLDTLVAALPEALARVLDRIIEERDAQEADRG